MKGHNFDLPPDDQIPHRVWSREVRGDQMATRECYIAMLEMDDYLQVMNIEE